MLMRFNKMDFENKANLAIAFRGVTTCMRDTELPVRVQACLSLQFMIQHESGTFLFYSKYFHTVLCINIVNILLFIVRNALIPSLPMIMQGIYKLTHLFLFTLFFILK